MRCSYNATISGPSGNITVNGTLTCGLVAAISDAEVLRRGLGAVNQTGININAPPYTIHNGQLHPLTCGPFSDTIECAGFGPLSTHTVATNATHAPGYAELDVHSLWGLMEERATHNALLEINNGSRPFLISRSTFPSSGKWSGHWVRPFPPHARRRILTCCRAAWRQQ